MQIIFSLKNFLKILIKIFLSNKKPKKTKNLLIKKLKKKPKNYS